MDAPFLLLASLLDSRSEIKKPRQAGRIASAHAFPTAHSSDDVSRREFAQARGCSL